MRMLSMTPCLSYLTNRPPRTHLSGIYRSGEVSVRNVPPFDVSVSHVEFLRFPSVERLFQEKFQSAEMPVSKSIKVSKNPQMNGFYVHSSPPKVLQVHSSIIRQWLRAGDLSQLEQLVLEGMGHKLVGEYSPDPKVRAFLKQVPTFLVKTKKLHGAIAKGDLKQLQKLLNSVKSHESLMKNIHMSKSQGGLGLLHRAVYYGHPHIVEFLISNFPQSVKMKDNEGKTPIYYCGASKDAGKIWPMLVKAGADVTATDFKGRQPAYYMERSNEIQLPEEKILSGVSLGPASEKNNLVIKPSNIRIWIHDRDLRKLQKVIWEGHGAKLRVETSNHPRVKRFLEGVPYILNIIKDVHSSVVNDDLEELEKKSSEPAPVEILGSKDINGLTPLHKAAGLNRKKMAEFILKKNPGLVYSVDHEGKTPLHYAAALKEQQATYNLLLENYADEMVLDKNGKTPPYYKANSKELNSKLLEIIPDAPRTSATFPQTFDWSLFQSEEAPSSLKPNYPIESLENSNSEETKIDHEAEDEANARNAAEDGALKESESEDKSSVAESEIAVPVREEEQTKNFDIWTNDDEGDDDDGSSSVKREVEDNEEDVNVLENDAEEPPENEVVHPVAEKEEENREEAKESVREEPTVPNYTENLKTGETRQKTEREIAEERQRLLDEGLLKLNAEEEGTDDEDDRKTNEAIEAGDMEKLASMVLNGEGNKILGKHSSNPEVQNFLDNVPTYMGKIEAVHKAARSGSLKDLQSALDRRKFAIAKDSSDKSGATPLHVAVIFENSTIIKYLGGRFPETMTATDKFGRTPLHYSTTLKDDGHVYNTLLDLGADPNMKDNAGRSVTFYLNNPGQVTRESLLEEMNLPPDGTNEPPNDEGVGSPVTDPSIREVELEISFDEGIPLSKSAGTEEEEDSGDGGQQSNFNLTDRDEYGQSVLHFAAARAHGRGGLFQLIHESGVNLGYRDELYRTARDIAQQANIPENVNEIDKYVISLAAKGETGKLVELFLEGYDHILDLEDDEDNDIVTIVTGKNHEKTLAFLKAIPILEEKREKVHRAVRMGDIKLVEDMITESKNGRFLIMGKNTSGRCSLHVAVLSQRKEITEFVAQKFPQTLKIGDNLERTPLHYAMGVEEVETLSKILIKCGAKRVVKDLKGRQPTYYFMNRTEILKLQEEENVLRV